jgi:hypothetical protein
VRWFDASITQGETVDADDAAGVLENESAGVLVREDAESITIALDRCIGTGKVSEGWGHIITFQYPTTSHQVVSGFESRFSRFGTGVMARENFKAETKYRADDCPDVRSGSNPRVIEVPNRMERKRQHEAECGAHQHVNRKASRAREL